MYTAIMRTSSCFAAFVVALVALVVPACSSSSSGGGGGGGSDGGSGGEGGPSGDEPINSADYDQSCAQNEDCVATVTGDACGQCNCPNDAIAVSAKAKYDNDYAALTTKCPKRGVAISCAACEAVATSCSAAKKCVLTVCPNGTFDAHHCIGDSDGGADASGD